MSTQFGSILAWRFPAFSVKCARVRAFVCECVRAQCDGAAQPDTDRHRLRRSDATEDGSCDAEALAMLTFTQSTGYCDIPNSTEAPDELASGRQRDASRRVAQTPVAT